MEKMIVSVVLAAIHSPQNGCFAREGEWLWLPSEPAKPPIEGRHLTQSFIGCESLKKSKFGWTVPCEPSEVEVVLSRMGSLNPSDKASTLEMLKAISKAEPGTPFGASYWWRVLPHKRHELRVHRVSLQG